MAIGLLATRLPRLPWRVPTGLDPARAAGASLVLLGIVLGPGIAVLDRPVLRALAPVSALAIGWIGAGLGARFEWRYARRIPRRTWLLAVLSAGAAFGVVAGGAWALTRALPALAAAWTPRLPAILTLAAAAAVSGSGAVSLVARTAGIRRSAARALSRAATLECLCAALVFTAPLALHRPHPLAGNVGLGWLALIVLAVGSGALVGMTFLSLARLGPGMDTGFALVATLLFGAGVGYAADLSPFVVCTLAAALIVNAAPPTRRHAVRQVLADWERPVVGALLVVAGALMTLPTPWILLAVVLLAGARAAAKWAAVRYGGGALQLAVAPPNLGLGTVAQGPVAVALGLNFFLMYGDADVGGAAVLTTVVLGAAVALLAAPPLMGLALSAGGGTDVVAAPPARLTPIVEPAELTADAPAELPR